MTSNNTSYHSIAELKFKRTTGGLLYAGHQMHTSPKIRLPEILFITSFPPRECGIATYSQDLINALNNQYENSFKCTICALESDAEQHAYNEPPQYILNTDDSKSFAQTAGFINKNEHIKLVVMQHEFGFFANKEIEYKHFFDDICKPIVFVFHTVLPNPNDGLRRRVREMSNIASSVVVMTTNALNILTNEYGVPLEKITVIPHGTHLVPPLDRRKLKQHYQLSDKKVLSTFGLLGSSKSIETTLNALSTVVKTHPEVLFLVLGKTHPSIVKQEGEQYRRMLEEKVITLHLQEHVRFVNEYLQLPVLLEYLQLTDVYLFTSKDPNQAVSGTFSYAVSCGCPVISTPIPHAKEVLSNNSGIIVGFEDDEQLSKAIISLLDDEQLRNEISSNSFHQMASTAWQNSAIAHALLFEKLTTNAFQLSYKIPVVNLNHIKKMTTDIGMIQFAKISMPDVHSGYTLDDNARALIAICQHDDLKKTEPNINLINTYLQFIKHCQQLNGLFLNYVNEYKEFTPQNYRENLEDSTGRAVWALGYVSSLKDTLPVNLCELAESMLQKVWPHLNNIHSTRAMAFIIKGLHYQNRSENTVIIEKFANRLAQMYKHESSNNWHWFENYLTYGNSLLPEAMLCAYLSTHNEEYKQIAKESVDFLLSKIFVDARIKVISNNGWHLKDKVNEAVAGGEQPIDVAYTIIALEKFTQVFPESNYKQEATIAFNWFLGDNNLHQIVYNPCTGGCYDGVEEHNVNLNQGAESTLSYLMARLAIERILNKDNRMPLPRNKALHIAAIKVRSYENIGV